MRCGTHHILLVECFHREAGWQRISNKLSRGSVDILRCIITVNLLGDELDMHEDLTRITKG